MEIVTGAIPSLLHKLGELLVGEYNLQKEVKGGIIFLQAELESMQGALEKISRTPADKIDDQDKMWARKVREMSYDIEDNIDKYIVQCKGRKTAEQHSFKEAIDRTLKWFRQPKIRRKIATEIREIKNRVIEVHERRRRYEVSLGVDKPVTVDPRLFAQYTDVKELVGIDEARDELINKIFLEENEVPLKQGRIVSIVGFGGLGKTTLDKPDELVGIGEARDELINKIFINGNEVPLKQGRIVSIVGFGGLGKTTLANAVYKKIRAQFDCYAFVSVSQIPDLKKLYKGLLYDLGKSINEETLDERPDLKKLYKGLLYDLGKSINEETLDERQLIVVLREFLEDKRYFVVVDDVWDRSVWKMIRRALPDNDVGYTIITTTHISHVAEQAGVAYNMKPLSLNNSRKLLYRRIFGNGNTDNNEAKEKCHEELAEVSDRILKKCAGVPLAIITMASLLACKARDKMEWYKVYNSVGTGLENNLDVENMRKILLFSYYELPCHLRACLLYLSMFPEDYEIEKDRLIRMWIGEGFIKCGKAGKSLFELGESYFNELINRSMIQPVYDDGDIMIQGCRVHDMVLDLIRSLSSEENFVTVLSDMGSTSPSNTIRRLSLQNAHKSHVMAQATWSLQHARSVVVFLASISLVPPLDCCHVLRVLDLEDCNLTQDNSRLKYLENLRHLRYLGLRETGISQLPKEIGNLQLLQTLDVRGTEISRLPSSVVHLRKLMCLYIDGCTRVPNGIGNLTCLEQLSCLRIDDSTRMIIEELGQLTELRQLSIELDEWNNKLLECLCKLQKMQELVITVYPGQRSIGGLDALVAPRHLRVLDTQDSCWFSTLPAWMNPLLLLDLTKLYITVRELHQADLEILGRLPALRFLSLKVDNKNLGILTGFVVGAGAFPCLVSCKFQQFVWPVVFQHGAMPRLRKLWFLLFYVGEARGISCNDGSLNLGLGNLPSLQDVEADLRCDGAGKEEVEQAKTALMHEAEMHPNHPRHSIYITADLSRRVFEDKIKAIELIGIEEAVNGLMNILTEGNELSMEQGKIVSIVGLGGLGKTTLAHAIYQKLRAQFNCYAFVSVSQNPDMKKLFKCMLYQLGKKSNANIHESILDERLLVYELIEFLQKRRYFIVVDGIWDISVWKMIRCALPTNNGGYIIITTTRIFDVAKQVGGAYYKMPNLCLQNSRILYNRRIFEIEDKDKYEFIKVSERILHKCGGVPLAIIMISGLLATKGGNIEECYKVCNSIGRTTIKDSLDDEENMKRILSLSYDDLPSHLRTCLLYLSVFPEGYEIGKDRLIRIWIAEDLIQCEKQGESLFEIGERYYYELIDRGMIQPVYKRRYYDMTENCRVHDMVFELICDLSCKENFVSILDHVHHIFPSKEIIQRLSLQNCMVDHATHRATMSMQEVRSVVVFPSAVNILPALASFRVLRVLDLQSCCLSQGYSLKYLENLVDLRYLGLRDTGISQLSREIGKLQFLQTLDVTGNEISSLPSTVVELKHLMCLRIDSWTRAPCGIGSFTSLEELSTLCIQDSTDLIEDLGNQTELRVLGIDCHTGWNFKRFEKSLVECLHKLQKIHTLSISVVGECKLDAWVAPPHLRSLEITGCCSSTLSAWLNPLLLQELSFLSIEVRKLRQEDLEILGSLPALVYLDVEVGNQNHVILRRLVFHDCSFPCLVHCVLRGYIGPVAFQQGAMVKLERLHLAIPVLETREIAGGFEFGLGNLPVLQDVTFLLRRGGAGEGEVEEAERALRRAIEMHPNHPTLEIL